VGGEERDEREHAAEHEVHAIDERVLDTDVDDMEIFFHGRTKDSFAT
jgi:hypothetical protein